MQRLRERGRFKQPDQSAEAMRELEDLASPVGAFIRDECQLSYKESIEIDELYTHYRSWCNEAGHKAEPRQQFGADLRAAAPGIKSHRPAKDPITGRRGKRRYSGITIGDQADQAVPADQDDAEDRSDRLSTHLSPTFGKSDDHGDPIGIDTDRGNGDGRKPHVKYGPDFLDKLRKAEAALREKKA